MAQPGGTPDQHNHALEEREGVRLAHLRLLAQVQVGEITINEVLALSKSHPVVAKTRVRALVRAVPGYGGRKADRVLAELRIAGGCRVGALNAHQHDALISALS